MEVVRIYSGGAAGGGDEEEEEVPQRRGSLYNLTLAKFNQELTAI